MGWRRQMKPSYRIATAFDWSLSLALSRSLARSLSFSRSLSPSRARSPSFARWLSLALSLARARYPLACEWWCGYASMCKKVVACARHRACACSRDAGAHTRLPWTATHDPVRQAVSHAVSPVSHAVSHAQLLVFCAGRCEECWLLLALLFSRTKEGARGGGVAEEGGEARVRNKRGAKGGEVGALRKR